MPLPPLESNGNLPPGVHTATLAEVITRFGSGSIQRQAVADRLRRIYKLVGTEKNVSRFIVYGSFITNKPDPYDVDIFILVDDAFDLGTMTGDAALVFQHMEADRFFGASVFWSTRSGAFGGEQSIVEYWQTRRDGGLRGIVEIVGGTP